MSEGRFFDGETGKRLDVDLRIDRAAQTLRITHPDLPMGSQYWPLDAIRALADHARPDQLVLSLRTDTALDSALITTARLTVSEGEMVRDLKSLCPSLYRVDRAPGTARRIAVRAVGATAALVIMLVVILPRMADTLAVMIPIESEVAYGQSVVRQMERAFGGQSPGGLVCSTPDGDAALASMTDRLKSGTDVDYDLNVVVFNHPLVNAFAAPGGQIVLTKGLLKNADHPDQVAAVLAHEIGHVEHRDTTRNALRASGSAGLLSMVLGDFAGGTAVLVATDLMLNASYTRDAEAKADRYALEMINNAGISAEGMAKFFDNLGKIERSGPELPSYFATHPQTRIRAQAARDFATSQGYTRSALRPAEWEALQSICDGKSAQDK